MVILTSSPAANPEKTPCSRTREQVLGELDGPKPHPAPPNPNQQTLWENQLVHLSTEEPTWTEQFGPVNRAL